jgi:hypothetical protein
MTFRYVRPPTPGASGSGGGCIGGMIVLFVGIMLLVLLFR